MPKFAKQVGNITSTHCLIGESLLSLMNDSWSSTGQKSVTVRAVDTNDAWSSYSNPIIITIDNPPHTISTPSLTGPTSGYPNTAYSFNAQSTDSQGHNIQYTFNWSDGSPQNTTGWYASGAVATMTHSWASTGQYNVTVRAQCSEGLQSSWSNPAVINIQNQPSIVRVQGPARASGELYVESLSATLPDTPQNGHVLIATVTCGATYSPWWPEFSLTQTGVTWTRVARSQWSGGVTYSMSYSEIWIGVVGSGASKTTSVSLCTECGGAVVVCEYSGIKTTGYLDVTANSYSNNNGQTATSGTTTTTSQANELWIAAIGTDMSMSGSGQTSPTNGFTQLDGSSYLAYYTDYYDYYATLGYLEKIVASTGVASVSVTVPSSKYGGCIATFKGTN